MVAVVKSLVQLACIAVVAGVKHRNEIDIESPALKRRRVMTKHAFNVVEYTPLRQPFSKKHKATEAEKRRMLQSFAAIYFEEEDHAHWTAEEKVFYKTQYAINLEKFLLDYGQNEPMMWYLVGHYMLDLHDERAKVDETFRRQRFEKQFAKASFEPDVYKNYLNANYSMNSMRRCSAFQRDFYVHSFYFNNVEKASSGLYWRSNAAEQVASLVDRAKRRSKRRGHTRQFELTKLIVLTMFLKQRFRCAHCGERMHATRNKRGSVSLDRKNNAIGYTLNNSQLICSQYQLGHNWVVEKLMVDALKDNTKQFGLTVQRRADTPSVSELYIKSRTTNEGKQDRGESIDRTVYDQSLGQNVYERKCTKCNVFKPCDIAHDEQKNGFSKHAQRKRGFRPTCKACVRKRKSAYERVKHIIHGIRAEDKKRFGTDEFTVTYKVFIKHFLLDDEGYWRCAVTGLPMYLLNGDDDETNVNATAYNVSIDAIDPNKPHFLGNIRCVCAFVNVPNSNRE